MFYDRTSYFTTLPAVGLKCTIAHALRDVDNYGNSFLYSTHSPTVIDDSKLFCETNSSRPH